MKSSKRLDSVVFQLTPTRTRCDLFIIANEKKEKIASGLLNPFLTHLKTAKDQIAQGGYSILLEPEPDSNAMWFTKGTVERFVRFVSTPEILERVYTIESEILQIEEAICIQGNNNIGLSTVDTKPMLSNEGNKPRPDANDEKAIVLYTPGAHPPEANGSITQEGNSKMQLLKVLETRKNVLQKEQAMAFARAVAAGFDMDHMAPLMSFSECFGASRLMDGCLRFMDLWKVKHESGQWLEIEAAEAMSSKSNFSTLNASGIMLSGGGNKQNELHSEAASENNGKASVGTSSDERPPMDHQIPVGHQEYFPGQFPHPMFPPWPMHSPPGAVPVFQAYPMQGMPYYQNYSGNGPFYQPPYPPVEDSRFNVDHRTGQKRQSINSRDSNTESESWETDASKVRSQDDLELEKEASQSREARKKAGKSGKKQSGMVVIRNINYITSKRQNSSRSESASDSETDKEAGDLQADAPNMMHKNVLRSSKRKGSQTKYTDETNSHEEETISEKETDGGHWQAFQNCLLRDTNEDDRVANRGMFATEKDVQMKRRQNTAGDDPLALAGRDPVEIRDRRMPEFHKVSGSMSRMPRASKGEVLISGGERYYGNGRGSTDDIQVVDMNGRNIVYRSTANDDFMVGGGENKLNSRSSFDPLDVNGFKGATNNLDRTSSHDIADESFIVPFRSMSLDKVGTVDRTAIDMDSELPSTSLNSENVSYRSGSQVKYEPYDLSLVPERRSEKRSSGYDPALDYEMQFCAGDTASLDCRNKEVVTDVKQRSKHSEDRKPKVKSDALGKKTTGGPMRKGKPSKMNPLDEARARAERLRTYKSDLQKMKKEKEEAEKKRIEALKMERQKRIAARGSSSSANLPLPSVQTRKQLPTKLPPISHKESTFIDSEAGSSSPLKRSKVRTASLGSNDSQKASKVSKSNDGSHLARNRLTRSVSSLSETKKESNGVTPDSKASIARIRRLSEPKTISHPASSVKRRSAEPISKPKVYDGPDKKKISAIVNLDQSKAATLPELKIKTSKGPLNVGQNKSVAKEMMLKVNGGKPLVTSESAQLSTNNDKISHQNDVDESPVIEKTVVMLECEKPSIPVVHASEERMGERKGRYYNYDIGEKIEVVSEYVAIRPPPSPMVGVDRESNPSQLQDQPSSYEMRTNYAEKESLSSISSAKNPYQAPYARVSSLEDPCTRNSEYGKAPQTTLEMVSTGVGTAKAHVSDYKNLTLEKIPEALEKPRVKESAKGFRRFLKLGRKNQSSAAGEQSGESIKASVNGSEPDDNATNVASSSQVHTLKNLIFQDEMPSADNSSQKSSRHFSLLSPFRSQTNEKKLIT